MIRPTLPADTEVLVPLAQETGVFKPHEIRALREVLDDYHSTNQKLGHRCVTFEQSDQILGFAYYAPAAMTDRTWYLVLDRRHAADAGSRHRRQIAEARRGRYPAVARPSVVHRNLVAAALRSDAQVLYQAQLRSRRHACRLLRRRRRHDRLPQAFRNAADGMSARLSPGKAAHDRQHRLASCQPSLGLGGLRRGVRREDKSHVPLAFGVVQSAL